MTPEDAWAAEDVAFGEFFDRLARAIPGYPDELPPAWRSFREQCEAREHRGRSEFGFSYRERDNAVEALEELADFANYQFFDVQVARERGEDEEIDTALMAAYHAYLAYHFTCIHRARRRGSP